MFGFFFCAAVIAALIVPGTVGVRFCVRRARAKKQSFLMASLVSTAIISSLYALVGLVLGGFALSSAFEVNDPRGYWKMFVISYGFILMFALPALGVITGLIAGFVASAGNAIENRSR